MIDVMRAILVLAVLAYHYTVRWAPPEFPFNLFGYDRTYSRHWFIGSFGVHLFFVISGYVITMSVLRSGSGIKFAINRFLRIYPGFLIASTFTFIFAWTVGPDILKVNLTDFFLTLLLIPQDVGHKYVDGAYWTLTVEAKFYFYVAMGYIFLGRRFWIVPAVIGILGPLIFFLIPGVGDRILLSPFISFFLFGMAAWYSMNERQHVPALILGFAGLFAYVLNFNTIAYDGEVSLAAHATIMAGIALIFLLARYNPDIRVPVLSYLGTISYEIYLLHQVIGLEVIRRVKAATGLPDMLCALAAVLSSIALAAILYHWLEPPVRSFFRRLTERPLKQATEPC